MNSESNKSVMRRYFEEAWNKGHLELLDELVAANYVNHNPFLPDLPPGPEGLKPIFIGFRAAFSDLNYTIEDLISEEDKVVTRWTMRGTHTGELMGIPPTGKQVTVGGMQVERIAEGKIVEHWRTSDDLGLLQQLGVTPGMQQT
jgi:steroid delta-isomerase-like uncharacterized protein